DQPPVPQVRTLHLAPGKASTAFKPPNGTILSAAQARDAQASAKSPFAVDHLPTEARLHAGAEPRLADLLDSAVSTWIVHGWVILTVQSRQYSTQTVAPPRQSRPPQPLQP